MPDFNVAFNVEKKAKDKSLAFGTVKSESVDFLTIII